MRYARLKYHHDEYLRRSRFEDLLDSKFVHISLYDFENTILLRPIDESLTALVPEEFQNKKGSSKLKLAFLLHWVETVLYTNGHYASSIEIEDCDGFVKRDVLLEVLSHVEYKGNKLLDLGLDDIDLFFYREDIEGIGLYEIKLYLSDIPPSFISKVRLTPNGIEIEVGLDLRVLAFQAKKEGLNPYYLDSYMKVLE